MNGEERERLRMVETGENVSVEPYRESIWRAVSASWDAQLAQQRRRRIVRTRAFAGFGLAATLLIGVFVGRWSVYTQSDTLPSFADVPSGVPLSRRIALDEHLRDSETLLVLFEDAQSAEAGLAGRARELAAASRMLINGGAAPDAELNSLLLDLELLLLQISHVTATGDTTEFEIAQAGVRDADAIARMRLLRSQDARFYPI